VLQDGSEEPIVYSIQFDR